MSDDKKPDDKKPTAPKATADRIPVSFLRLIPECAINFPGEQLQALTCEPELKDAGRSYVCAFIPSIGMFEITCGSGGRVTEQDMIPREQVQYWRRFPTA